MFPWILDFSQMVFSATNQPFEFETLPCFLWERNWAQILNFMDFSRHRYFGLWGHFHGKPSKDLWHRLLGLCLLIARMWTYSWISTGIEFHSASNEILKLLLAWTYPKQKRMCIEMLIGIQVHGFFALELLTGRHSFNKCSQENSLVACMKMVGHGMLFLVKKRSLELGCCKSFFLEVLS